MIKEYQIKGLEKLLNNSGVLKEIYPMLDHIEIPYDNGTSGPKDFDRLNIDIFINDPNITSENMYNKEFDPHYLVGHHIRKYMQYFNIDNVVLDFIVWGPDGEIVTSHEH